MLGKTHDGFSNHFQRVQISTLLTCLDHPDNPYNVINFFSKKLLSQGRFGQVGCFEWSCFTHDTGDVWLHGRKLLTLAGKQTDDDMVYSKKSTCWNQRPAKLTATP